MTRDAAVWSGTLLAAAGGVTLAEFFAHPIVVGLVIAILPPLAVAHVIAVIRLFRRVGVNEEAIRQLKEAREDERREAREARIKLDEALGKIADALRPVPVMTAQVATLEGEIKLLRDWRHQRNNDEVVTRNTMASLREHLRTRGEHDAALTKALADIGVALHQFASRMGNG